MPTQIEMGMTTEKHNQVVITPNNKPKPPIRDTGTECSEREFGWSSTQSAFLLISHKIEKKEIKKDTSGAATTDRGESKTIVTGLSVISINKRHMPLSHRTRQKSGMERLKCQQF